MENYVVASKERFKVGDATWQLPVVRCSHYTICSGILLEPRIKILGLGGKPYYLCSSRQHNIDDKLQV